MPVSEKLTDAVRRSTEAWREKMLRRYTPTERLASLGLDNTRIVLQRIDSLWTSLGHDRVRAKVWTIERQGHKGEPCLLMLMYPSIEDTEEESKSTMKDKKFTVLEAEGVCLQTAVRYIEGEDISTTKNMAQVATGDGQTYIIDMYTYGLMVTPPVAKELGVPAAVVVRDQEGGRWFVLKKNFHHNLELVDREKRPVLEVGGLSLREALWQSLGSRTFGPRRRLPIRHLDKAVPKEVVLFLASRALYL
ncbi:MAG: hypothetical protein DRO73_10015 [Candidatus Thorarchaeota archaeon]|nr:MAG: hypothetical protein DRO73_10015 [Candidatus Thorarchaeota archaeon]